MEFSLHPMIRSNGRNLSKSLLLSDGAAVNRGYLQITTLIDLSRLRALTLLIRRRFLAPPHPALFINRHINKKAGEHPFSPALVPPDSRRVRNSPDFRRSSGT